MSGGTLEYHRYDLENCISEIEKRIFNNGKTLQQIWDDKSEEEKNNAKEWDHDWEIPWNEKNIPDVVRSIAEDKAWKKCKYVKHEQRGGCTSRSLPTKKARENWNRIYNEAIKQLIEGHNNGIECEVYSAETVDTMRKMLDTIKRAKIYLNRIDYLFSGDDGESNFVERTKEDLKKDGLDERI